MSRYRTRSGVVLRRSVTPAGDVLLSVLAPEGKLRVIARSGARGPRASRLNLFQHLTFQVYEKPGADLATLTQVTLEGALPGLTEPLRYPYAHLLAEIADRLYQENDRVGQAGFELFTGGLRGVARHPDPDRVALVIVWKLLALAGLFPRVGRDLETGETGDLAHFDPQAGGALSRPSARSLPLGAPTLEELALIARGTVREVMEDELPPDVRDGLWRALEAYTRYQVGELQVWGALRSLRAAGLEVIEVG